MSKFTKLCSVRLSENRDLVVSIRADGRYSIAQRVSTIEDGKASSMFVKNALVVDVDTLTEIASALVHVLTLRKKQNQVTNGVQNDPNVL